MIATSLVPASDLATGDLVVILPGNAAETAGTVTAIHWRADGLLGITVAPLDGSPARTWDETSRTLMTRIETP